jgi:hypothetical protein
MLRCATCALHHIIHEIIVNKNVTFSFYLCIFSINIHRSFLKNKYLIPNGTHKVPDPNKAHLIFVFKYRLVKTSKKFGCGL